MPAENNAPLIVDPDLQQLVTMLHRDCRIAPESIGVVLRASDLRKQQAFAYWDRLLVATAVEAAVEAKCATLYAEDMQPGQRVQGCLSIINPLVEGSLEDHDDESARSAVSLRQATVVERS